ncbi:MAG TPA: peptidase S8 [Pseudonocardiaceae bacterium]|jgi:subtilase family serine protease|nr:peptidase S8 [Pseudonocardiaceae bacterium]
MAQPLAASTPSAANSAAALTAQVRQEVRGGTLLRDHGVHPVCPQCQAQVVTTAVGSATPLSTAAPSGYGPSDLATAYSLPGSSTSTNTIAIIDAGVDPNLAADLATYRSTYGLAACTTANGCLTLENYTGGAQPAPQKSGTGAEAEEEIALETSLDVDMASAACPSCHLLEVSVPWQAGESDSNTSTGEFAQAVATAASAGANSISISYGYSETSTNVKGTDLADFNKPGVAITVSTGDAGFNGGTHQDWPSDLPSVIAVGGTSLASAGHETAWSGGGSGCETAFTAANGQPTAVTSLCHSHRAAADVSADADPNTGLAVYDTYAPSTHRPDDWTVVGGTSASAPFVGGLFARAGNLTGVNGPNTLYAAASSNFNDITRGNNEESDECADYTGVSQKVCNAGTGWDGPTGLGSPHGLGAF